jgi:hypothetical protein
MKDPRRELDRESVAYQVDQLQDYIRRGGSVARWFQSKDLEPADCRVIRDELRRRERARTA